MRLALRAILAAAIAVAYALAIGYLSIRVEYLLAGLDLGWTDDPYVVDPQFPLQYLGPIALLSALCAAYIIWRLRRGGRGGYAEAAAFVAVLLAVVVWGIVTYESPTAVHTLDLSATARWRYAALSPALHTVMVLPVVVAVAQAIGATFGKRTVRSAGQDDTPDGNPYAPPVD
ncbi:hypothetical protein [Demequina sp.]|uniref:hypothetical protein n=1 Tax=Demequina sp. TaxID=2050685 RepID=UPI0025BC136A|nr:hypothetical protein [Demequina sp.]